MGFLTDKQALGLDFLRAPQFSLRLYSSSSEHVLLMEGKNIKSGDIKNIMHFLNSRNSKKEKYYTVLLYLSLQFILYCQKFHSVYNYFLLTYLLHGAESVLRS